MSDGDDLVPGNPGFERALAQGQFEFAKTRYARTLTSGSVKSMLEVANRERARLTEEIKQLQIVSRNRYEAAIEAAQNYAMVLPHRVGRTWLQPPAALERVGEFFGSMRLYRAAAKAAKDFSEAQELLAKRHLTLVTLERQLRERLDGQEAIVHKSLATPDGLKYAIRRDPLLELAYNHMRDVANGPDGQADAFHPADPLLSPPPRRPAEPPESQFPDEPAG